MTPISLITMVVKRPTVIFFVILKEHHSHQEVSSYVPDWDGDSDRSSCSPLFEALTPNKNFSILNVDAFVAAAAPKASTLGLFSRTTNVPSYAFISFPYRC
ncbi:hypothetical protein EJD97_001821 [Solanum chilense]|uniref:Uncharacterized protein n=1 Tax=Solanum chilense TaxID=4083 RepID=A0A6N2ANS5_SOLCI|nr:hypothetical protein EJD97_001821 [Solanum chilense]